MHAHFLHAAVVFSGSGFSLLETNSEFSLHPYLRGLEAEFAALGIDVNVTQKTTTIFELAIDDNQVLKIKRE
jgi:hypothetical protein